MTVRETLKKIQFLDGWLSSHEGYFLYEAAQKVKTGEIVEIGSWMGKSTICLAAGSQVGSKKKITAVDPHKGTYTWGKGVGKKSSTYTKFLQNLKDAKLQSLVSPLVMTSEKAAKSWKKPIGLLFIDGLHDYRHTKQDFSLWYPHLKKDGALALHDAFCGHVGPEKIVLEEILPRDTWSDIGVVGSIIYARKGKPKNILQKVQVLRCRILIPFAFALNKLSFPYGVKFFLIHRVIKFFLLNSYTLQLLVYRQ